MHTLAKFRARLLPPWLACAPCSLSNAAHAAGDDAIGQSALPWPNSAAATTLPAGYRKA